MVSAMNGVRTRAALQGVARRPPTSASSSRRRPTSRSEGTACPGATPRTPPPARRRRNRSARTWGVRRRCSSTTPGSSVQSSSAFLQTTGSAPNGRPASRRFNIMTPSLDKPAIPSRHAVHQVSPAPITSSPTRQRPRCSVSASAMPRTTALLPRYAHPARRSPKPSAPQSVCARRCDLAVVHHVQSSRTAVT